MPKVIALVPCHNEEATVAGTVESLLTQDRPVDRLIVVDDRSTDNTSRIAHDLGVEVFTITKNEHMKGGALNQAIEALMPLMERDDVLFVVDADSIVGENFVSEALNRFSEDPLLAGVSGSYLGKSGGGVLGWYQRNEFARWSFDDRQANGRTVILSGAASAFKVWGLAAVKNNREMGKLKGSGYYDTGSFTEDFELSLALLHSGFRIRKMLNVTVLTSYKPTWSSLFKQRLRWDRGISENLLTYKMTRHTKGVVIRRAIFAIQCPLSILAIVLLFYRLSSGQGYHTNLFWITIAAVLGVEKMVTVWSRGFKHAIAAFVIAIEVPFDMFLQLAFMRSVWDMTARNQKSWR